MGFPGGDINPVYPQRRRHPRFALQVRCWCTGGESTLYVTILNASQGGVFIKTYTPFSPGEKVRVKWAFPDGRDRHEAVMEVVWKRESAPARQFPGMGLKFVDLPEPARREIERLETGASVASGGAV